MVKNLQEASNVSIILEGVIYLKLLLCSMFILLLERIIRVDPVGFATTLQVSDVKPKESFDPFERLCEVWGFNAEAKRNIATHSDLSVEIKDPEIHLKA